MELVESLRCTAEHRSTITACPRRVSLSPLWLLPETLSLTSCSRWLLDITRIGRFRDKSSSVHIGRMSYRERKRRHSVAWRNEAASSTRKRRRLCSSNSSDTRSGHSLFLCRTYKVPISTHSTLPGCKFRLFLTPLSPGNAYVKAPYRAHLLWMAHIENTSAQESIGGYHLPESAQSEVILTPVDNVHTPAGS